MADDQLRDLVTPVGEFDPPLDLHTRILAREHELAAARRRLTWRPPRVLMLTAAAAGLGLLIVTLAFAAHSRTSAARPANSPNYRSIPPTATGFCATGDITPTIEVRPPSQRQLHDAAGAWDFVHSPRPVATLVVQNTGDHSCYAAPAFDFKILDQRGRTVAGWDSTKWFAGTYQPGGSRTFSLPAVYSCERTPPFTAVAVVGNDAVRRHGLIRRDITC